MDITEIQDELLHLEYPNLLPDHDPDIERYYYLRSIGQSYDALGIYQNRLAVRYPDDAFRTLLLRSYRSHDPMFRSLLARGYRMLGERSLGRVKRIILAIAEKADSFNEKDIYSTIKTAEEILQFLSPDRYEAMASIERFLRYATVLDIKAKSMAKAEELVRSYLTDTLSVVETERRRRSDALRKAEEETRKRLVQADWDSYLYQKKFGAHSSLTDLSTVIFSEEDLRRIEIPPFTRLEDRVLGYCIKYWNAANDPAFERILFLYSRKYGKKNYDIYMTIRRGQAAKRKDDEILASIMSILVTGYYYSIQGDLYLQRSWATVKYALENQVQLKALPAELSPPKVMALPAPKKAAGKTQAIASRRATKNEAAVKVPAVQSRTVVKNNPVSRIRPAVPPRPRVNPDKAFVTKPVTLKTPVKKATTHVKTIALKQPAIVPLRTSKTTPKIAPKPATSRPAAVVARAAGKPSVNLAPQKPVKVPYKLKPAEQPKTTILTKPVVLRPEAAPARPVMAKPWMTKQATPAAPIAPKPAQRPAPLPAPKPVVVKQSPAKAAVIPVTAAGYRPAPFTPASPPKKTRKIKVVSNKTLGEAKGSVQDRLRILSGRSYDVYEDRFLSKARSAIRKVLGTGKGMFFNLPEEAEDMVYNFLRDHYADPYMDWEVSADRKNLLNMGFDLPSINPVIDECYRSL